MSDVRTTWPYPRWIAHRGAGKLAPENTLAAFRLGAEHGFRMFECDAKLSADGVPFLLHDATLERTSNGRGVAGELIVGLRPEHATLRAAGGLGWPFRVEMIEMLGAERLVHGKVGKSPFTVRVDATLVSPRVGDLMTLQGPPERLHWFDAQSGKRIPV